MSQENYNPNSIDATLARIEQVLTTHVNETREYRRVNDDKHVITDKRVTSLEADRTKLVIAGTALGTSGGAVGSWLHKIFGS
jgi:molybdopterin biosynthesis enzyme MoaB